MNTSIGDFAYFALIYNWLNQRITQFGSDVMGRTMVWVSSVALILITLWVLLQGYRMVTGQSREPMMAMVSSMGKIAVIVTVASTMSLGSTRLQAFFTTDLAQSINELITGTATSPIDAIDQNLAYTQMAMAAIDAVQVPAGDTATADSKARATLIATLGTAGPAMSAGAMLLLFQVAIALFIGLGPLFILCLIFDQTKELFRRWLMYGLGTLFSLAVLNFVVSLVLQMTLRVAAALWGTNVITSITGLNAEGFTGQAMQQGGVGLLMTVLIISTPVMAAMFFNGTMGNFSSYSAFGGGGTWAHGQHAGTPAEQKSYANSEIARPAKAGQEHGGSIFGNSVLDSRRFGTASTASLDAIRPYRAAPELHA
jgi:type IV secretion system protein VirB6